MASLFHSGFPAIQDLHRLENIFISGISLCFRYLLWCRWGRGQRDQLRAHYKGPRKCSTERQNGFFKLVFLPASVRYWLLLVYECLFNSGNFASLTLKFCFLFTLIQSVDATAGFPWYVNPYQPSSRFLSLKYSPVRTHILINCLPFKSY